MTWAAEEGESSLELDRRPVIVGVALRPSADVGRDEELSELERNTFHGVMGMIRELLKRE